MTKEQIIKALYDANTDASSQIAHDEWSTFYQAASKADKKYLMDEYLKFGEHVFKQNEESNHKMREVLAEYESKKLEMNRH